MGDSPLIFVYESRPQTRPQGRIVWWSKSREEPWRAKSSVDPSIKINTDTGKQGRHNFRSRTEQVLLFFYSPPAFISMKRKFSRRDKRKRVCAEITRARGSSIRYWPS